MSCLVCGKLTREGVDICSTTCALQPTPRPTEEDVKKQNEDDEEDEISEKKVIPRKAVQGRPISSLVTSLQDVMMLSSVKQEYPMIRIQHAKMKNRNFVCNRTVLSFNDKGIAVLLISCEVRPKCINSDHFPQPDWKNFSLRKYSTAFTS